jgi:hypothetical protein
MLPAASVMETARRLGALKRERKLDPLEWVWALISAGGTEECGRLASAVCALTKGDTETRVARNAFYQWFEAESDAPMQELAARCCALEEAKPKHLPGILARRRDWCAEDSTVVNLTSQLYESNQGTGDGASLTIHKTHSLGAENNFGYHITPGLDHYGTEQHFDESWRNMDLVVDPGDASFRLLRETHDHDIAVALRLKEGGQEYLDESVGQKALRSWLTGTDLEALLRKRQLPIAPRKTIEVDVHA